MFLTRFVVLILKQVVEHGDFPIPVKDYKKLVTNILDYWDTNRDEFEEYDEETKISILRTMINAAFGFEEHDYIDIVYPKTPAKKNGQRRYFKDANI